MSGDTRDLPLIPSLYDIDAEHISALDHFYPDEEPGVWHTGFIGLGRHKSKFDVSVNSIFTY